MEEKSDEILKVWRESILEYLEQENNKLKEKEKSIKKHYKLKKPKKMSKRKSQRLIKKYKPKVRK